MPDFPIYFQQGLPYSTYRELSKNDFFEILPIFFGPRQLCAPNFLDHFSDRSSLLGNQLEDLLNSYLYSPASRYDGCPRQGERGDLVRPGDGINRIHDTLPETYHLQSFSHEFLRSVKFCPSFATVLGRKKQHHRSF